MFTLHFRLQQFLTRETVFARTIGVTNTFNAVTRSDIPPTDECTFGHHCRTLDFFPPVATLSWIIYMLYNKSCIDSPVLPKLYKRKVLCLIMNNNMLSVSEIL